jgi:hypothetical protein
VKRNVRLIEEITTKASDDRFQNCGFIGVRNRKAFEHAACLTERNGPLQVTAACKTD